MAEVLGTAPPRPPTPPRSSSRTISTLQTLPLKPPSSSIRTPEDSPSSSAAESSDQLSSRTRKKVEFSTWSNLHKAPLLLSTAQMPSLKVLPPSKDCKSTRSILKPGSQPSSSPAIEGRAQHTIASTTAKLDSIVKQLAGDVRASSLDAYASLCGTMKAYEGVPEPKELANNMRLIMQFLRRDLSTEVPDDAPYDTSLIMHALKLLVILVWNGKTQELLLDDFRAFVLERAIRVLE